ncbi:AraC family transcriptional regulator [Nocardia wallacei]|uniref:AraC family transcriptional regulator n=1 Tax=Nocardia wallacei TaxID=480035 RepID=UPI002458F077|nr:AraC family transcriptional regulator [Nocardia wallacei]
MPDDSWCVRSVHSAAVLLELADNRPMSRSAALAGTGLGDSDLDDVDAEIDLAQEFLIAQNILTAAGDEAGLGLLAGIAIHLSMLGHLGIALSSCATVREMAGLWARYSELSFAYTRVSVIDSGSQVLVTLDESAVPAPVRRFALERDLALLRTVQRELLNWDVPVQRLEVSLPYAPVYEAVGTLLGIRTIVFGKPATVLILNASDLDRPMPQANTILRRQYERLCAETIERRRARIGLSGQVRALLLRHGRVLDQATIAAELHMSVRTLRRRLAEEGTTFRDLVCETTCALAKDLLAAGFTIDTVAGRLGYASTSAFTAAFRDRNGQTPGQFARTNRRP